MCPRHGEGAVPGCSMIYNFQETCPRHSLIFGCAVRQRVQCDITSNFGQRQLRSRIPASAPLSTLSSKYYSKYNQITFTHAPWQSLSVPVVKSRVVHWPKRCLHCTLDHRDVFKRDVAAASGQPLGPQLLRQAASKVAMAAAGAGRDAAGQELQPAQHAEEVPLRPMHAQDVQGMSPSRLLEPHTPSSVAEPPR